MEAGTRQEGRIGGQKRKKKLTGGPGQEKNTEGKSGPRNEKYVGERNKKRILLGGPEQETILLGGWRAGPGNEY
mgnify:CR=1 FL=1